ncbi:MAG: hypothetical protein DELT_02324 [Desulfovibrio sp.]
MFELFRHGHHSGHRHMHGRPYGFGRGGKRCGEERHEGRRQFQAVDAKASPAGGVAHVANATNFCPACERHCPLTELGCGKGVSLAQREDVSHKENDGENNA